MNDLPDHPIRRMPEFVMLHQVAPLSGQSGAALKAKRFGVKLRIKNSSRATFFPRFVWVYGPTPYEAMNSALAHLVTKALNGDAP